MKVIWSDCWWLMHFFKKTWSNECVWKPINGFRWRRKMIKWMWCCYRVMGRQAVDAKNTCTWCRCHQMHWRLNEMSELLHLMLRSLDALTELFWCQYVAAFGFIAIRWKTVDARVAAFDRDEVKCTGGWRWCQDCCIRSWNDQMHADDCLKKLSELHLMSMSSDVLTIVYWCQKNCIWLRTIRCTDEIVCDVRWLHSMLMH